MKQLFTLSILFLSLDLLGQDTINLNDGTKIIAQIMDVNKYCVSFLKYEHLNGSSYYIPGSETKLIIYHSGEKITFKNNFLEENIELFDQLTKKGNKVYIDCPVPNAIIHATKYLNEWGYWSIIDNKEQADFILKLVLILSWPDYFGYAQFIDPKSNSIIKQTKKVSTGMATDPNTKRKVIEKIIRKGIKPFYQ